MKLALLIVLFATLPASADPPAKPAKPVIERLELTAKVLEIPKPIYFCGVIAFREVIRYEVISVDQGTYGGKEIFVVELCPENLKVGQTKKLSVERETKSDQGYVDKFPKTQPRWVARYR